MKDGAELVATKLLRVAVLVRDEPAPPELGEAEVFGHGAGEPSQGGGAAAPHKVAHTIPDAALRDPGEHDVARVSLWTENQRERERKMCACGKRGE